MFKLSTLIMGCATLFVTLPVGSHSSLPAEVMLASQEERNEFHQPFDVSDDLENLLVQSLKAIHQQRFDAALGLVDRAIELNPNFRLAHLIKGDLMLAKVRPLHKIGGEDLPDSQESLDDLRHEALVRLTRYDEPPPVHLVPDALLELSPQQKIAILVDTSASRVYLFENNNGKPRYLSDYYVTVGKQGVGKKTEGDKRTPLGVYHVTKSLDPEGLPDLYGDGAYPINYPNALDRRKGRTGYGIWLHGSPSDTYSRPPQASDGCVVLTNPDIVSLGSKIQVGLTPVVITPSIQWIKLSEREIQRRELNKQLESWRRALENRNSQAYLSHYATEFWTDSGSDKLEWGNNVEQMMAANEWLQVELKNVSILRYPDDRPMVEVKFDEIVSNNETQTRHKKHQYWVKKANQWQIVYEGRG